MSSLPFCHLHSCPPFSSVICTHVLPPLLSSPLMSSLLFCYHHSCPPSSSVICTHVLPSLLLSGLYTAACYTDIESYDLLYGTLRSQKSAGTKLKLKWWHICYFSITWQLAHVLLQYHLAVGTYATSVSLGSWYICYFSITWQLAHMLLQYHLAVGTYSTSVSHGSWHICYFSVTWHIYYFSITWQICYFSITWHMYVKFQALITNLLGSDINLTFVTSLTPAPPFRRTVAMSRCPLRQAESIAVSFA